MPSKQPSRSKPRQTPAERKRLKTLESMRQERAPKPGPVRSLTSVLASPQRPPAFQPRPKAALLTQRR